MRRHHLALVTVVGLALAACGSSKASTTASTTVSATATTVTAAASGADASTTAGATGPSGGAPSTTSATATPSTTSAATATPTTTSPASVTTPVAGASLIVQKTALGDALASANKHSVYMFLPDGTGKPTCVKPCSDTWLPATVSGTPSAGPGLDPAKLGTTTHPQAGTQLTYAGHPLYNFKFDPSPGEINGEGTSQKWYLVKPDGTALKG